MTDPNENLFTPLTFGQTLKRAFVIFGRHWITFLCLLLFLLTPLLVILITTGFYYSLNVSTLQQGEIPQNFGVFAAALMVESIIYMVFAIATKASLTQVVLDSYAGIFPIHGCVSFKKTLSRFPTLLCFAVILWLILFVSTILPAGLWAAYMNTGSTVWLILAIVVTVICFVWVVYLSVSLVCTMPAILAERRLSATNSMRRSHYLSIGYFCYIFSATFLIVAAAYCVVLVLGPFAHFVNIILFPILSILSTVIYLNLRVCKEDLTRETLATELGVDVLQPEVPMMATGMPVMMEDIPIAEKEENDII
jgi:hypothetical protein